MAFIVINLSEEPQNNLKIKIYLSVLLVPTMERERPPTQIIMAKLNKAGLFNHLHGVPPPKVGFRKSVLDVQKIRFL